MPRRLLPWAIAGALACIAPVAGAQQRLAVVSFLEGSAQVRRDPGIPQDLRQGSALEQGDVVETGDDSRLELKLLDASLLRIGERARLALTEARFERGAVSVRRHLSVTLVSGRLWAKAVRAEGGDRTFQVGTENVVASARGAATFRVDNHHDRSVLLRVYSGAVALRRDAARDAWEKVVEKQMQILVSADGTPGVPAPFTEADEQADGWAAWNRKLDGQRK